jgi:hypothetical protein
MKAWHPVSAAGMAALLALPFAMAPGCGTASTTAPSPGDRSPSECDPVYFGAGGPPPVPPDGASLCDDGVCNYQTQAGCAATETCSLRLEPGGQDISPICRPAGAMPKGSACDPSATALDKRCGKGLFCSTTGCRKLCCGGDWTACDPGESCIRQLVIEVAGAEVPAGADLCLPVNNCNPLDPEACAAEGRVCRIADPTGNVACMPPSNLGVGDPCDQATQCGPRLHCTRPSVGAQGTCHHLCAFGPCVPDTCGDEGTCVHFPRDPDGIGECVPGWTGPGVILGADGG